MIFVTVGTTVHPFFRMNRLVENLLQSVPGTQQILYQAGATPVHYRSPRLIVKHELPYGSFLRMMESAETIICHGGPASIYHALLLHKTPYVLPRRKEYGEHVNDHQVHFAEFMAAQGKIQLIDNSLRLPQLRTKGKRQKRIVDTSAGIIAELDKLLRVWGYA